MAKKIETCSAGGLGSRYPEPLTRRVEDGPGGLGDAGGLRSSELTCCASRPEDGRANGIGTPKRTSLFTCSRVVILVTDDGEELSARRLRWLQSGIADGTLAEPNHERRNDPGGGMKT